MGEAETEKSGTEPGVTVIIMPAVCVVRLFVACTVIENVPVGVALLVTMVSVDCADAFPEGMTVDGLNPVPASTWLPGRFTTERLTAALKLLELLTITE
jgi:hypothetical protein